MSESVPTLLTIKQLALRLQVNRNQISTWVRQGKLQAVTLPGRKQLRFTEAAIADFIDQNLGPFRGPFEQSKPVQTVEKLAPLKRADSRLLTEKNLWRQQVARKNAKVS